MTGTILLLGNYRPSLTLARTLEPMGYRLIVSRGLGEGACEYSKHIAEVWDHPPLENRRAFASALTALLLSRPDIQTVFPVLEDYLVCLSDIRPLLPANRTYVMPDHDMVSLTLDKARMTALAETSGIPVAPHQTVDSIQTLHAAADQIGYPLVVRPYVSGPRLNGRKALIARTPADLAAQLPTWPQNHRKLLIQRYVSGKRVNHYLAAQNGHIVRLAETHIHETEQPDGTGLATYGTLTDATPALEKASARLMEALDYTGIGLTQFMCDDRSGETTFLEFNCRVAGSHMIAEVAGLELGKLALDLARTPEVPIPQRKFSGSTPYVWTYGAIRGTRAALADGDCTLSQAVTRSFTAILRGITTTRHMTWDRGDPLPTLVLFANALLSETLCKRLFPTPEMTAMNKTSLT